MWLAALLLCAGAGYGAAELPYPWGDDDDDAGVYDRYQNEAFSSTKDVTLESQLTRVRRYEQTTSPARTLSADEIREVKGVLSKMMAGRRLGYTRHDATDLLQLTDLLQSRPEAASGFTMRIPPAPTTHTDDTHRDILTKRLQSNNTQILRMNSMNVTVDNHVYYRKKDTDLKTGFKNSQGIILEYVYPYLMKYPEPTNDAKWPTDKWEAREKECLKMCTKDPKCKAVVILNDTPLCKFFDRLPEKDSALQEQHERAHNYYSVTEIFPTTPEPNTTTTIITTTEPNIIDINKLVRIIANLTMNTLHSNLSELFNATLQKYGIPMCGDTTTTEEPTYDFVNATIISKCFVCGLEDTEIPINAYCADAFAGDFLPLVPVDPKARGHIASYRKYCRYLDVPGMLVNETQPRSVFGRWTGGCSVRWVDLSGVYTQRACRNRRHATMGRHFVSKRLAKLEMALKNEDNGCIISPMASLVPLSRGISLYARFHACVCTGSWCNAAPAPLTDKGAALILTAVTFYHMKLILLHM